MFACAESDLYSPRGSKVNAAVTCPVLATYSSAAAADVVSASATRVAVGNAGSI
jgi:hypothetical protein